MGYRHIENLYKNKMILMFKECYAMEKIHGCLKKGTLIKLSAGEERPIEKIKAGDCVVSFEEKTKNFVKAEVAKVIIQEKTISLPWLELLLENGRTLVCTEDHKLLTSRGWVEAKDLTLSDDIVSG
jgi:hypothetical protein